MGGTESNYNKFILICLSTKIVHISLGSLELVKCLENLEQNDFEVYSQSDQNTNQRALRKGPMQHLRTMKTYYLWTGLIIGLQAGESNESSQG